MAIGYLDDSKLTNIANAIRSKTGSASTMTVDAMPTNIASIQSPIFPKDVNFYDYDGTLLASYTLAEAQNLSALPPLPIAPEGYTATAWTEDLTYINSLTDPWDIGVKYTCNVEYTRFTILIEHEEDLEISFSASRCVSIDWGDGTTEAYVSGISHIYSQLGTYDIKAYRDTSLSAGLYLDSWFILPTWQKSVSRNTYTCYKFPILKKVFLQTKVIIYNHGLGYYCLDSLLIPIDCTVNLQDAGYSGGDQAWNYVSHITSPNSNAFFYSAGVETWVKVHGSGTYADSFIGSRLTEFKNRNDGAGLYAFDYSTQLREVVPKGYVLSGFGGYKSCPNLTYVDLSACTTYSATTTYTFQGDKALTTFISPEPAAATTSVEISTYTFQNCVSLCKVVLSTAIKKINGQAFNNSNSTFKLYLKGDDVALTAAFYGSYKPSAIYVPTASVETYKTASIWSNYADVIYGWDPSAS